MTARHAPGTHGKGHDEHGDETQAHGSPVARAALLAYLLLIVYASWYPFTGWRSNGLPLLSFMNLVKQRYWTGFDVMVNVVGYVPLGILLVLALYPLLRGVWAALLAAILGFLVSASMETVQNFLPSRVPSNLDLLTNSAGCFIGACLGPLFVRILLDQGRLIRLRKKWFAPHASQGLVLLALWPLALMFPVAVPFGLGQVYERAEAALLQWLADTPWIDWLPLREVELQPMLPLSEWLCIAMGLLLPCLLAFSVLRTVRQRVVVSLLGLAMGVAASTLSAALSYGPSHAWDWISPEVLVGLALAALALTLLLGRSARSCLVVALVLVVWQLALLNQASADVYFAQTLQHWEQGRFIRFHGLIQWLGWLWPYALLWHLVRRLSRASSRA